MNQDRAIGMDSYWIRQGPSGPATVNRVPKLEDEIVSKTSALEAEHVVEAKTLVTIEKAMETEQSTCWVTYHNVGLAPGCRTQVGIK